MSLHHTGTLPSTSHAFITLAELPSTPTSPSILILTKTYLLSDIHRHDISALILAERIALARLSSPPAPHLPHLLAARANPSSISLTMRRSPGLPATALPFPLPPARVSRIARQVMCALQCAHGRGVVHADLTLRNVVVDAGAEDAVCLVDFGACVLRGGAVRDTTRTSSSTVVAPEVAAGAMPGPAADIWGLGVFIWVLLFGGAGPPEIGSVRAMFGQECCRMGVVCQGDWAAAGSFVEACLVTEPTKRFACASEHPWDMVDYQRIKSHPFLSLSPS